MSAVESSEIASGAVIASEDVGQALAEVREPGSGALYSPDRDRERTRSALALGVLLLLVGSVLLIALPVVLGIRTWSEEEGMAASVLPAVLTVIGTVLGYYFGSEKR